MSITLHCLSCSYLCLAPYLFVLHHISYLPLLPSIMASLDSGPSGPSTPAICIAEQDKAVLKTATVVDENDDEIAGGELGKYDGDLEHGRKQV